MRWTAQWSVPHRCWRHQETWTSQRKVLLIVVHSSEPEAVLVSPAHCKSHETPCSITDTPCCCVLWVWLMWRGSVRHQGLLRVDEGVSADGEDL